MRRRVLPAATFWPLAKPSAHHRPLLRLRNHRRLRRAAARSSTFSPQVCFLASRDSSPWPLDETELPFVGAEAHVGSPNCAPSSWRSPSLFSQLLSTSISSSTSQSLSIFTHSLSLSQSSDTLSISLNLQTLSQSRSMSPNFTHSANLHTLSISLNLHSVSTSVKFQSRSQSVTIAAVWSHRGIPCPSPSRCPCLVDAHRHDSMHAFILTGKRTGRKTQPTSSQGRQVYLWSVGHTLQPLMSSKVENCTSANPESCSSQENS